LKPVETILVHFQNLFEGIQILNLNSARRTLALHFLLSLSSISFSGKPTKGREGDLLGDLLSVTIGSGGNLFPLSYSVGIEGEE
jgi:hypothetical protein